MPLLKCVLLELDHINEILFTLAHQRTLPIVAFVANNSQKAFYELLIANLSYTNIHPHNFDERHLIDTTGKVVVLMDVPATFELMAEILDKCAPSS